MKNKKSFISLVILLLLLSACAELPANQPTPMAPTVSPTGQSVLQETTPSAGLVLQGNVTVNGKPLAGVRIFRSYASYPGEVVATSGKDGTYRSEFMFIPGDEMVTVWAELEGYAFTPENVYWRHYHGYEERTLDFSVVKVTPAPVP
jgi:hypothetical protein